MNIFDQIKSKMDIGNLPSSIREDAQMKDTINEKFIDPMDKGLFELCKKSYSSDTIGQIRETTWVFIKSFFMYAVENPLHDQTKEQIKDLGKKKFDLNV